MFTYKKAPYKIFALGPKFCWTGPGWGYCGHWMIFNKILLFVSQTENRFEK